MRRIAKGQKYGSHQLPGGRAPPDTPADGHTRPDYRSGFRHFSFVNRDKSASVDLSSQPCSIAKAARWPSLRRLPVARRPSSNSRNIAQCDDVGPVRQTFGPVVGAAPFPSTSWATASKPKRRLFLVCASVVANWHYALAEQGRNPYREMRFCTSKPKRGLFRFWARLVGGARRPEGCQPEMALWLRIRRGPDQVLRRPLPRTGVGGAFRG